MTTVSTQAEMNKLQMEEGEAQAVGIQAPMSELGEEILRLENIRKVYPNVVANDSINLRVLAGEIHAVLGENGAGKSTLMKIIYGAVQPSAGTIFWRGAPVDITTPAVARHLGIGMVFQYFSLFETLSVADNIDLSLAGMEDRQTLVQRIEKMSHRYGLEVDHRRLVCTLSVGERQKVEIVRCLLQNPRLLIMDEPTSVLPPQAVTALFVTLRGIAANGCSILYISHKLAEVQALCHVATFLRQGKVTGTCDPTSTSYESMVRMMIGSDDRHDQATPVQLTTHQPARGAVQLQVEGLSYVAPEPFGVSLHNIQLAVHAGEIVGIAGVSGNGQQPLLRVLSGDVSTDKEHVRLAGVAVGHLGPQQRRRLGLRVVPEDRLGQGAVPYLALSANTLLTACRGFVRFGFIQSQRLIAFARQCIQVFAVRCSGEAALAASLSGGNLQKFIIAREILQKPRILIAAQPTSGVDIGAATFIRQALLNSKNQGMAIVLVSDELDELFAVADRIAVMVDGYLSPILPVSQTSVQEIGAWMSSRSAWQSTPQHLSRVGE